MKEMRRILALVLCFVMLVGILPVSALATETVPVETSVVETTEATTEATEPGGEEADGSTAPADETVFTPIETLTASESNVTLAADESVVVVAASDYQESNSGTTMTNIMKKISETYPSAYGILLGGDYDAGDVYPTTSHLTAVNTTISNSVYSGIAEANRIMIQGNHETYGNLSPDNSNLLDATGGHDTDYYGVYAINYEDFDSASSGLNTYLSGKTGYTKPIFVMSHQPLHVTSRGDNNAATNLFDVLNSYEDLNIIFLFGHNHSGGYDAYLGNGSIYLKKGDSITVAGGSTETLNFTYMNYGYVGYVNGSADTTLTMTAFEISDSEVAVKRYDASGLHNLKASGTTVSGYNTDTNVYGTAVLSLSDGTSTISAISEDSDSGDSSTGGTTGGSTSGSTVYTLDTDGIDAGEEYLIVSTGSDGTGSALTNNSGSSTGTEVTISGGKIELDNANAVWIFSDAESGNIQNGTTGYYVYPSSNSDSIIRNEECALTFSHEGNGEYFIKRSISSGYWTSTSYVDGSDWSNSSSEASVYLYKKTSEGSGSTGGSTVTTEGGNWVTVSSGEGGIIYELDKDGVNAGENYLIVNTSSNGSGNALTNNNGSTGNTEVTITDDVIRVDDDTNIAWVFESSSGGELTNGDHGIYLSGNSTSIVSSSVRDVTVESNGDGSYVIGRSGYQFWVGYDDGWVRSGSETSVYLYRKTGTEAAGDAEYAKIDGELTYTVARGATAEEALAAVMEGIDVLTSANADGSNPTTLDDSNTDITWTLASSYDGTVPGEYAVTISYKGIKLGTAKVVVPEVTITGYECQTSGSVKVGATGNVRTGANITVNLEDGTSYTVPVTVNMLTDEDGNPVSTDEAGEITGLKVVYNGETVCENFTLTVREPVSYPEYPDEGAVKVNKTATGVQFQSTGVAQVEVSASGIPMNQGVDILLVLDTSSSMNEAGSLSSGTRMSVLKECINALIQSLKAERADGSVPDVDFSVVDFAGYFDYKTINYIEDPAKDTDTTDVGEVLLDWTNVQNVSDTWGNGLSVKSGTNYDHGLQLGYDQLLAKQQQDEGTRKQFVLFMSDGAPYQYNGIGSLETGEGNNFEKWLLGTYTQEEVEDITTIQNPEFYFESDGSAQKNRIAEAIKGSTTDPFYIPSYTEADGEWTGELVEVYGLGATMYSVGYALQEDYSRNPTGLDGMNAILNTIASENENGEKLFYSVESKEDLEACFDDFAGEALMAATNARFVDQMGANFNLQMGAIKDLDGNVVEGVENKIEIISYDIYTRSDYLAGNCTEAQIGNRKGTYTPLETVTFNDDGSEAYSDKDSVGPDGETITAGSNILIDGVIYASSFWYNSNSTAVTIEGVDIPTGVDAAGLTTGSTNVLPAETFYWKVGTIKTTELAMRYYVYLTGSMEGTREAGSYPTNEYANLYYNNYLNQPVGQPCQKTTVSPVMAWEAANVSYAFYLVDENGNIIVNQTTGETGSFANKIAVTNPVVYKEIILNNIDAVESIEVASLGVLPDGYELYDGNAVYTIEIDSDATGSWAIAKGDDKVASTYVTNYDLSDSSAYTNELSKNSDADFTHTVVWFAVLWKVQALPDAVVIDYGLPVDISVLTNDMFGEAGKLAGVGAYSDSLNLDGHDTALASGFGTSYTGTYGVAEADTATGKVRYTLNTSNGMQMQTYDKFAYAANYTGATNPGYYYDTVTVIPATTVYYEDDFLTYSATNTQWEDEGTPVEGATQAEDRPGQYSLTDANNIYGYDAVNKGMSTFSLGTAKKVHVYDANSYATASFTFAGTGFDVIGMTSNTTGVIAVQVTAAEDIVVNGETVYASGATAKSAMVNTYYGYTSEEHEFLYTYTNGDWVSEDKGLKTDATVETTKPNNPTEGATYTAVKQIWVATPDTANSLYQVPVMQIEELPYGKYNVVITATYASALDKTSAAGYDLYLDAIRIYDPANDGAADDSDDTTIESAYVADGEGWPSYFELRNKLISTVTLGNAATDTVITGEVFIDGDATVGDAQLSDYMGYGPNNEVYLASGQSVAFLLGNVTDNVAKIHIGISNVGGTEVTYHIENIAQTADSEKGIEAGQVYNEKDATVATSTDMYYDLTGWKNDIIVITNTGDGILSLTNIKSTYKSDPAAAVVVSEESGAETSNLVYAYMTSEASALTLRSVNAAAEEEVPETTVPETTVPETTVPETTVPEETETETTTPEETEPETSAPEETEPKDEETKPSKPGKPDKDDKPGKPDKDDKPDRNEEKHENLKKAAEKIRDFITDLIGKWFR